MRILSGLYRGRMIKMPKGIRPTQDKVRKALFDILKDCIGGAKFLDLFAGSGAVGIEALSRGAKEVVFVEDNRVCFRILKDNLTGLQLTAYSLQLEDVFRAIENMSRDKQVFDIVFLDPPYYKDLALRLRSVPMVSVVEPLAKNTLQSLSDYDILTSNSLVVVQHYKKDQLPDRTGELVLWRKAQYGDTVLSFYKKELS